jgi:RNA polymerase sigma-70 factor (ECF subfamily)
MHRNQARLYLLENIVDANPSAVDADVEILHRIARRDEAAVGQLYDKHAVQLFTLLVRILHDHSTAEDVLQEVFLRVWNRAATYDQSLGSPIVWLTRIARNLAIDTLRSKLGQRRKLEDDVETHTELRADEATADPSASATQSQQHETLRSALATLPEEQRILIEYAYYQGYTQSELAEHFDIPLGTVKTRIRTGMMSLRRHLHSLGFSL